MSIQEEVFCFIKSVSQGETGFDVDANLLEKGVLDSVAMMELVLWSEERFSFVVDTDDMTPENFATVNSIVDFIKRNKIKVA